MFLFRTCSSYLLFFLSVSYFFFFICFILFLCFFLSVSYFFFVSFIIIIIFYLIGVENTICGAGIFEENCSASREGKVHRALNIDVRT